MIKRLQKNSILVLIAASISLFLLITGCNNKDKNISIVTPVTNTAQNKPKQAKPVQKQASSVSVKLLQPPTGNQFDFSGKKDPFKPDNLIKPAPVIPPGDQNKVLMEGLPIHNYDVSQFRLIGIVTGAQGNQAMVVDPTGKGYVLKVGMTIGKSDGRITAIGMNGVEVVEQFKDDNGRVRKENIRITLPRKQ
ncbi:pilus assembly protein PilP [Candidatus Nomurabacteria bacterium]|nr:pilus assembly protein PilP [Candidatus Nomurabacteria bacterium]